MSCLCLTFCVRACVAPAATAGWVVGGLFLTPWFFGAVILLRCCSRQLVRGVEPFRKLVVLGRQLLSRQYKYDHVHARRDAFLCKEKTAR